MDVSPIERISRALCCSGFDGHDPDEIIMKGDPPRGPVGEWRDGEWYPSWPRWMSYEPQARAVLQAIREPSEGMVRRGGRAGDWADDRFDSCPPARERENAAKVWQAMIDAALSE